jgi:hypothetical protein
VDLNGFPLRSRRASTRGAASAFASATPPAPRICRPRRRPRARRSGRGTLRWRESRYVPCTVGTWVGATVGRGGGEEVCGDHVTCGGWGVGVRGTWRDPIAPEPQLTQRVRARERVCEQTSALVPQRVPREPQRLQRPGSGSPPLSLQPPRAALSGRAAAPPSTRELRTKPGRAGGAGRDPFSASAAARPLTPLSPISLSARSNRRSPAPAGSPRWLSSACTPARAQPPSPQPGARPRGEGSPALYNPGTKMAGQASPQAPPPYRSPYASHIVSLHPANKSPADVSGRGPWRGRGRPRP